MTPKISELDVEWREMATKLTLYVGIARVIAAI